MGCFSTEFGKTKSIERVDSTTKKDTERLPKTYDKYSSSKLKGGAP